MPFKVKSKKLAKLGKELLFLAGPAGFNLRKFGAKDVILKPSSKTVSDVLVKGPKGKSSESLSRLSLTKGLRKGNKERLVVLPPNMTADFAAGIEKLEKELLKMTTKKGSVSRKLISGKN